MIAAGAAGSIATPSSGSGDSVSASASGTTSGPAAAVALIAAEGLIALVLVALAWPELRRPVDLLAGAPQPAAGATSSRICWCSSRIEHGRFTPSRSIWTIARIFRSYVARPGCAW